MKKQNLIFILASFLFFGCNSTSNKENDQQKDSVENEVQSIGGNKDKHGCLTAAGQTWSQIKNDCIQVFSVGIRLNPIQIDSSQAIISAFVVPNEDSTAYELFLPDNEETLILNKSADNQFTAGNYKFDKSTGELLTNDKPTHKTE